MSQRLRLYDFRTSRGPQLCGLCQPNIQQVASLANTIQRRLIFCPEAGNEGWYGSWAEMAFNVTRANPYLTLPREVARLEFVDVCKRPVNLQNQFYEYLEFGNGRMPQTYGCANNRLEGYTRNNVVLWQDLGSTPQLIRGKYTNTADVGKRVLIQGTDTTGAVVYSDDSTARINGAYLTLANPYVTSNAPFASVTGVQKDVTLGDVQIFLVDPITGTETLALTMQPGETTAWYRRYYFHHLPDSNCCGTNQTVTSPIQVLAIVKLEVMPVAVDQDWLVIQNLEAMIEEGQAVRHSEIDDTASSTKAQIHHREAVHLLRGELDHYEGVQNPAFIVQSPGGTGLPQRGIGCIV